jgi:hypothetical protein
MSLAALHHSDGLRPSCNRAASFVAFRSVARDGVSRQQSQGPTQAPFRARKPVGQPKSSRDLSGFEQRVSATWWRALAP